MEKTNDKKQLDMTHGSLFNKIVIFTIPIMLSGILQLLFNAADVIVVGRYAGKEALAAVGSTSSLINLMLNLFIGFAVGANVCAAQYYGANHEKDVSKTLHTSAAFSLICGVVLIIAGLILAEPMLLLMGSPDDVIDLAVLYVKLYFLGAPATVIYNFLAGILRASGDTKHPLYFLTAAGIINVALNLLFVIKFDMSVAGVAIATVISQYISGALLIIFLMRKEDCLKLKLKEIKIDKKILSRIIRIGLPAGIQGAVFSISNVVIQSAVNSFGSSFIAGSSAASSIEGFVYISMNSVAQSCVTFTGQNYGAGDEKRVKKVLFQCVTFVFFVGLIIGNLVVYFARPLLSIYTDSAESIEAGVVRLTWVCTCYFLCGIMDVLTSSLRGIGKSTLPMVFSILGACASRLVWISTYFRIHPTEDVLFFSYPGSWALTIICHAVCFVLCYNAWVKKKYSEVRF